MKQPQLDHSLFGPVKLAYRLWFILLVLNVSFGCVGHRHTGWNRNAILPLNSLPKKAAKYTDGMVLIPGGTFTMGADTYFSPTEKDTTLLPGDPPSRYSVSDYYISDHEVTNAEYGEFITWVKDSIHISNGNTHKLIYTYRRDSIILSIPVYPDTMAFLKYGSYMSNEPMSQLYFSHPVYKDYPIVGVNWQQAMAYCHWRSMQLQRIVKSSGMLKKGDSLAVLEFRLPTEAEWQYAAIAQIGRAKYENINDRRIYPWDGLWLLDKKSNYLANFGNIIDDNGIYAKYYVNDGAFLSAKVKSYPGNDFGLYDMAGNVAEWTIYETCVMNTDLLNEYGYNPDFDELFDHRCFGHFEPPKRSTGEKRFLDSIRSATKVSADETAAQALEKIIARNHLYARFAHKHNDLNMLSGIQGVYPQTSTTTSDSLTQLFRYLDSTSQYRLKEAAQTELQNERVFAKNPNPRTVKGGSWADGLAYIMCANREAFSEDKSSCRIGFRVAMSRVYNKVKR